MKNLKNKAILFIIGGIFCFYMSSYMLSGEYTSQFYSSGGRTLEEFLPYLLSTGGAVLLGLGIYFLIMNSKESKKFRIRVLSVNKGTVVVEFEDGKRKNLMNYANLLIVAGEIGVVEVKGNIITGFSKL